MLISLWEGISFDWRRVNQAKGGIDVGVGRSLANDIIIICATGRRVRGICCGYSKTPRRELIIIIFISSLENNHLMSERNRQENAKCLRNGRLSKLRTYILRI